MGIIFFLGKQQEQWTRIRVYCVMKSAFVFGITLWLLSYYGGSDGCDCWNGFTAAKIMGKMRCYSRFVLMIRACDEREPPFCLCEKSANAVIWTEKGTYCVKMAYGKETRRWKCENKYDWKNYANAKDKNRTKT